MAKYGKKIDTQKKFKKLPSIQSGGMNFQSISAIKQIGSPTFHNNKISQKMPVFIGESSTNRAPIIDSLSYNSAMSNPFYNYLIENAITRTTSPLYSTGAVAAFTVMATGLENLLKKGDRFFIYHPITFKNKSLIIDEDLDATTTNLRITSTTFERGRDRYPSGSFILPDYKSMTQRVSQGILYKKFTLSNAEYTSLNSSPYTLLAAVANYVHMPISCYVQYVHGADEMTSADLFIGNSSSTSIANYWGSIDRAFYRNTTDQLNQIGASTYGAGASTDFSKTPTKVRTGNAKGDALYLYTSADFTSASSYIIVNLWYQSLYNY